MSVATAAKIKLLSESKDYAATVYKEIGDLDDIIVFGARVLVAIYFRPEKIMGIIRPQSNVEEDAYQSKVGLVLKLGPDTFDDSVKPGDYVVYRASDGFPLSRNGVPCRILRDESVMLKISNPMEWF
jgi:hypothetical protein